MESGNASENTIGELQPVVGEKRKSKRAPIKGRVSKKVKQEDEDVCFVCLNGGDLVLCDFKGCPKAYHLGCIQKDKSLLSTKMRWICGWHLCTVCLKRADYMCYTCSISYCKNCVKEAEFVCVRGKYGFCGACLKLVMMLEVPDAESKEKMEVDFDDPDSWDYLFKLYWIVVKDKLSLTLKEMKEGRNTWNEMVGSDFLPRRPSEDGVTKTHEHSQPEIVHQASLRTESCGEKSTVVDGYADWGSRELLEFVSHMKNGDTAIMSRSNVQLLLLDYINANNLHDPNLENQIICDEKLKSLFGKPFVGHMEMVKLLDLHFMKNGSSPKKAGIHVGADEHKSQTNNLSKASSKKDEDRTPQTNFDDYAAIDVHNISLIFLRRSMIESILGEVENFHEQVVGSIVRISVSHDGQKPDMHRLVQVVGTSKGAETYQVGDKTTDIMLEVLNLTRKESIQIDAISDQDFSADECKRLHQGIKFGLVKRLAVEEIQSKAVGLQALKFHDWLAAEILRLNHMRNQAQAKGLEKEVLECTEKLKMLKTPEERQRRLSCIPEVHSDPKMNPSYESEDEEEDEGDKPNGDALVGKFHKESTGPQKSSELSVDVSNVLDLPSPNPETGTENMEIVPASEETCVDMEIQDMEIVPAPTDSNQNVSGWQAINECIEFTTLPEESVEDNATSDEGLHENENGCVLNTCDNKQEEDNATGDEGLHEFENGCVSNTCDNKSEDDNAVGMSVSGNQTSGSETAIKVDSPSIDTIETEEIWRYRDPHGTIQGPFSMKQLRFWSTTGFFPPDMKTWNGDNEKENSILISDALVGKFHKESTDPQKSSELSVDDSNVLDLPSPNPETGTEENSILISDALVGKSHKESTDPQKSSELSVDDSNVLDLPSPNPEIGTENMEIVPASEENYVDMEIQDDDMKLLIGNDLPIFDPPTDSNQNVSSWQAINECIEFTTLPEESVEDNATGDEGLHEIENGCVSNTCDNKPEEDNATGDEGLLENEIGYASNTCDNKQEEDNASGDEGLHEIENGCVSNTCDNKPEEDYAVGMSVSGNQTSGSETAIKVDSPSIDTIETEEIWRYRDRFGTIQGPFSMQLLRLWNSTGYFPPDLKTWNSDIEEENSILISDALVGKCHKVSTDPQKSSELSVDDSNVLDLPSPNPETCTENLEIVPASEENHVDMVIQANDMNVWIEEDLMMSNAPTNSNENMSSWQEINEFVTLPEEELLAEINAMGGGGGGGASTTDMIDFVDTGRSEALSSTKPCPLLEAVWESIFGNSDGAANNPPPPPTESSSSFIQK